jgi:tetratricopeptide (TPR) repeat protein
MGKRLTAILLSAAVVGAVCCTDPDPKVVAYLHRVEGLMFTDLDSARVVFGGIDPSNLSGRENLARYRLLQTIMNDRLAIQHESLDDILFARDYLAASSASDSLLAIVHLYTGRVYEDLGEPERALESLLLAKFHIDNTENNNYWKGRVYFHIGVVYNDDFDFTRSISFVEKAIHYYSEAGDSLDVAHAYNLQGFNYTLREENDMALKMLSLANDYYLATNHSQGALSNGLISSGILLDENKPASADSLIKRVHEDFNGGKAPVSHYPMMSQIEAAKGNYKMAIEYLQKYDSITSDALLGERATSKYLTATYYADLQNYSSAYNSLGEYIVLRDSMYEHDIKTTLQEVEKRYDKQTLEREYATYRTNTAYKIVIGGILFIIIIVALAFIIRKRRQRIIYLQTDLDRMSSQMNEFEDLRKSLSDVLDKHNEKEARLHDLLTNKMLHLKKMVDYLFLYDNNPDEFKKRVGSAVIQAEKDTYFGELREVVNEKFAGIVDYLEVQFPTLTEDELNLCCLVCFGFNNNQISILFGYTNPNSIFNKRHKLRKKMGLWPNYESLEAYLSQTVEKLRIKHP